MRELTNTNLIVLKAALFVVLGTASATLLFLRAPAAETVLLTALVIWSFARAYYFAFYVLEKYVDPAFRFSGLVSAARYLLTNKRAARDSTAASKAARR